MSLTRINEKGAQTWLPFQRYLNPMGEFCLFPPMVTCSQERLGFGVTAQCGKRF